MSTNQFYDFAKTTPILVREGRFHWLMKDGSLWTDFKPDERGKLIIHDASAQKN